MSHALIGSALMTGDQVRPVDPEERRRPGGLAGRRGRIIVLLGTDGAGKTTIAAALVAAEQAAGRPAILLRNRSGRRWLSRTAARCGLAVPIRWVDRVETVVRTANVLVARARGRHREGLVVMDRHLVCQLVLRRVRGLPPGRVLPWLAAWVLRGVIVIVLDVPAETAQARILTRGEDDEPLEYLRAARSAYLELAQDHGWALVDATGVPEAVIDRVAQAARL
ncbi:dTMP kinase [Kocuria arenosa]|uniref:dTMP kinase n=1 Tax=Kocuria arenosa TaxID=3071446 RepID=UPI0034D545AA